MTFLLNCQMVKYSNYILVMTILLMTIKRFPWEAKIKQIAIWYSAASSIFQGTMENALQRPIHLPSR